MIRIGLVGLGDIGLNAHLPALQRNSAVTVTGLADPIEESFPYQGHTDFLDMAGTPRWRAPRAEDFRAPYQERLAAQRAGVEAAARQRGWDFLIHRTDASAASELLALHARLAEAVA